MSEPRVSLGIGSSGAGAERVCDALDSIRPIVHLGSDLSPAAAVAAVALVSMLGRMFPHIQVRGCARLGPNPWSAATTEDAFILLAPSRPPPSRGPATDLIIGIGNSAPYGELAMGGDDWTARVGRGPQPIGPIDLGLGLQAAAAFLASEVAKGVLGSIGMAHFPLADDLVWNLLDYTMRPSAVVSTGNPAVPDLALLGGGSVGSSVAGVLTTLPRLDAGIIDIVDGDVFDPTKNPFRYPASLGTETGPKVDWLARMLSATGWTARPFFGSVAQWIARQPTPGFDGLAVSSVDGVEGRLQVADVLARTTLSVGVRGLALHLQREILGDGYACSFCDFVDLAPPLSQVQVWSKHTGLTVERIARLIALDGRLEASDVDVAIRSNRLRQERSGEMIGRRLIDLVGRLYAEATVPVTGAEPTRVTAPYVSWMGGVLAAAEIAKAAFGIPPIDRRVDLDLSGIPTGFTRRKGADRSGRCVCWSPIRRRWLSRLY